MNLPVEPHVSLAFSLQSQPGAYAVLLGAGVSAAAGVPAAWEIQRDLITRIATMHGVEVPSTDEGAFAWYEERYKREARYDELLAELAATPNERQAILRDFFEPDDAQRNQGLKLPTAAHRAVAELVASGHIRIVLTLNFDHLMEQALRDRGIVPTVIAGEAAVAGMLPLHAHRALVWHLHGEYTSPATMLNTPEELANYPAAIDAQLDRLVDEYGWVITGWSAKWDPALRDALARGTSRRFASFWCDPYPLGPQAEQTLTRRGGTFVQTGADQFFQATASAVAVLAATGRQHPLSAAAAVAAAKRELATGLPAVNLHDALRRETAAVNASPQRTDGPWVAEDAEAERDRRLGVIEARCETLVALTATAAYWGGAEQDRWWRPDIEHRAERPAITGLTSLISLAAAPAALMLYAAGVAAVAAERWDLVGRLLAEPRTKDENGNAVKAAAFLSPNNVLGGRNASARLYRYLEAIFTQHLTLGTAAYTQAWERFEYLRVIGQLEYRTGPDRPHLRAVGGRDAYRPVPSAWLEQLLEQEGAPAVWVLHEQGFFEPELLVEYQRTYDQLFSTWATHERWATPGVVAAHPSVWYPDEL